MFEPTGNSTGRSRTRRVTRRVSKGTTGTLVALAFVLSVPAAALGANYWHYSGPVRALLTGQNHDPTAKKVWKYTVHVFSPSGAPLSGTINTAFALDGEVVGHETPPTHKVVHGYVHDTITFPKEAVGHPIDLQIVVHSEGHSFTLDWAIDVKK